MPEGDQLPTEAKPVYPADPGERFTSNVHRRVLGHLATPDDDFGWDTRALMVRMFPDPHTPFNEDEIEAVADELVDEGLAEKVSGAYRMTQEGFERLQVGLVNEPPEGAEVVGPAIIGLDGQVPQPTPFSTPTEGAGE